MAWTNRRFRASTLLLIGIGLATCARSQDSKSSQSHVFFRVQIDSSVAAPLTGRLLVFLQKGTGDTKVDTSLFHPESVWIAAQEVHDATPGKSIELDANGSAYPTAFSEIPPGDYEAQAVVDTNHSYNYSGRGPQDWISPVITLTHWTPGAGPEPVFTINQQQPANPTQAEHLKDALSKVRPTVAQKEEFDSPLLTQFWGHPTQIRAWVILPPGYDPKSRTRYPTVYWTHGFGGNLEHCLTAGLMIRDRMEKGKMPPMIWVMLDESIPEGTHEFADSVNDGPWGTALTTEFLPYLEHKYRMDARRNGRFLNGHSSGGWATLQLEVNYPKIFGGTWSTSPDPSDFHDFTGPDLYAPNANVYRKPDGTPYPLIREDGKVIATFEQFAKLEAVLGPYGGQMSSFDWVFSPRGDSGAPQPMFDRKTGDVNPGVVAYWSSHYDLAHIVETHWPERGTDLRGRIHLIVGTADTFYLDGSAHKFEAVLQKLHAEPHFSFLPGKTHANLYAVGDDRNGLFDQISAEMYAVSRPKAHWKRNGDVSH